ncbi:carbohydrate porin [Tanticharoenia sakaeratensis]|uniref:Carbohydrate-selective porin OprB n=1 Tax=Tanticharoenia sakaeratensis NBRC 103193 TaxID=1231623 RepID=A0A0D6MPH6_9PROT|nr:carbohydrate porin [Tanticharoenia sakaeratensis]GAN55599.1 carbohydrate-selective porin OprB [Tanticharoenia sakaeratensis NBRC 103193]GBQ22878.1 carbohydrate-selective porin B [Tanticharoenia sakaeratensis NBRC 103193]
MLASISRPALAQFQGPISQTSPTFALDTPTAYENTPFTPNVEHAFGTWGGSLPWLKAHGVGVVLDYTSESTIILDGKHGSDASYLHQIGLQIDLDWERLIGLRGFRTHAVFVNRAGHSMASDYRDYSVYGLQEIYGGGGNVGVHMVYFYATQDLWGGRVQLAAGKLPVSIDFSASPLFCTFVDKSICGNPKSLTRGANGFSTYPYSSYGGRARIWPVKGFYVQTGLYGTNAGVNTNRWDRTGFEFGLCQYQGIYIPTEIGIIPSFGPHKLVGHYKIGVGHDSAPYADELYDATGGYAEVDGRSARMDHGKVQLWVEADQMIMRNGWGPLHGLYLMTGLVHNTNRDSVYNNEYYAGLIERGLFHSRPEDTFGIAMSHLEASGDLVQAQRIAQSLGLPLPGSATAPQGSESMAEATYIFHVYRGTSIQPDYQHIFRPNLERRNPDIDALGIKLHSVF